MNHFFTFWEREAYLKAMSLLRCFMRRNGLRAMQNDQIDKGGLKISVVSSNRNRPIANARIEITYTGDPERIVERLITDENGQIPEIELSAPPIEYSMTPSEYQPYSEYDFRITADEFEPITISGAEILPEITALQTIKLNERSIREPFEVITIPDHTLYGNYPPKIPEDEIKPVDESGEIVLSRVVIPEFIVVHDGSPEDSTANDYYVRYRDYIKNVASSEIYATWPRETIKANVLIS